MTDSIEISPVQKPISSSIRPPGSKSITNRALVCAALAQGKSKLTGTLVSEDTEVMIAGLRQLGIDIQQQDRGQALIVTGCQGKVPVKEADIFVGNSGTTIRFLTALTTLGRGIYRFDGIDRMRERPIGDLVEALTQLGAQLACTAGKDCPPLEVRGNGLPGGTATIRGNLSSQFLSGLLMTAPCAAHGVTLQVKGTLVSRPYIAMTLAVMQSFGVTVETDQNYGKIRIPSNVGYSACHYEIEPDASAASYFWAAAAITGGEVTVTGLSRQSLQGDVAFVQCLEKMGCKVLYGANRITVSGRKLRGIDVDMNAISDTVQTLAVVALFAEGKTTIRNVPHIRHKETDRITAVATELRKLGAKVLEYDDGLEIHPGILSPASIDTYNDHRMAMSFSLAGLMQRGVIIKEPDCTAKTYPKFFTDLAALANNAE